METTQEEPNNAEKINQLLVLALRLPNEDFKTLVDSLVSRLPNDNFKPGEESMKTQPKKHTYDFKIYNGRVKVYVDGFVMFSFNQIDFAGYYAYNDDETIFGLDIYLNREKAGSQVMEIYFKTKENWLAILELLDKNL